MKMSFQSIVLTHPNDAAHGANKMKSIKRIIEPLLSALTIILLSVLTGCGAGSSSQRVSTPLLHSVSSGGVHGGQQAVTGAVVQLWGVGLSGYGSAATPLLTTTVTTSDGSGVGGNAGNGFNTLPAGFFTITGDYSCPSSDLVYMTAVGGNPGMTAGTNNSALTLMAALGSCSSLMANASTEFINIDEVTTVASVWALSRFMTSYSSVGAPSSNIVGLTNAFAAVNKLVNVASGTTPGTSLPAGATLPVAEINAIADILSVCINSSGGSANDGSLCGKLFQYTTQGSSVPADTVGAALNMALYPVSNVAAIFLLLPSGAPFQPSLSSAPNNWMIGVNYVGGGLNAPTSMAVDSCGCMWVANKSSNTISKFDNGGNALSATGFSASGNLNAPSSLAVDVVGNVWVTNAASNSVVKLDSTGNYLNSYSANSTLSAPSGIAIDGFNNLWIANSGNNSVSVLNNSGAFVATYAPVSGINAPAAIAINAH